jgi:dTDP-4-amino-4,6-dideoxy-D-galactose acyltransferase
MTQPARDLVELLDWDTDFWGVRAARVHPEHAADLDRSIERCEAIGVRWASLLVATHDLDLIGHAVRSGFAPVDVRITLSARPAARQPATEPLSHEHLADASDAEELARLARGAFTISRFYADPHLPDARCADFYETWIRNSIAGQLADVVVVRRSSDGIDGFVTVRKTGADTATLPLVAVRADRQGQGVGKALMSATSRWLTDHDVRSVDVTTQLANVTAIRLYESGGFKVDHSGVWLHRWSRPV